MSAENRENLIPFALIRTGSTPSCSCGHTINFELFFAPKRTDVHIWRRSLTKEREEISNLTRLITCSTSSKNYSLILSHFRWLLKRKCKRTRQNQQKSPSLIGELNR